MGSRPMSEHREFEDNTSFELSVGLLVVTYAGGVWQRKALFVVLSGFSLATSWISRVCTSHF